MTFGQLYSENRKNEPLTKQQRVFKKWVISYILEIPRLLLASVLACIMVAVILRFMLVVMSVILDVPTDGTGGFWRLVWQAWQYIILGHMFAGPALLLFYLPVALYLKDSKKRGWLLPLSGISIATINAIIVTAAVPFIGVILIPCSVIAGLFTGAFHDLFLEISGAKIVRFFGGFHGSPH